MDVGRREHERRQESLLLPLSSQDETKVEEQTAKVSSVWNHPALYVAAWMVLSCTVIFFNKWILDRAKYPIFLTCYHLTFATIMTQSIARTTSFLDGRHSVKMTPSLYLQAIVPIGVLYSLSLVCSNLPYLYLSVAFIQMLKGTAPIAVFFALCSLRLSSLTIRTTCTFLIIAFGIILASLGEIRFRLNGFVFQMGAIVFEAYRLAFTQKILTDEKYQMDPLVSLYYFAPCSAAMIALMGILGEWRSIRWEDLREVEWWIWAANGIIAMGLNVAGVFLIGKTSSLVLTLCGVLKNIVIIGASVVVWNAVVTPMQILGNGIAMAGLIRYHFGEKKMLDMYRDSRSWCTEFWQKRSTSGKMVLIAGTAAGCVSIMMTVATNCGLDLNVRGGWRGSLIPSVS